MLTVHYTPIIIHLTIPCISTLPVPHHSQCLQYTRHQSSSISQYPVSQHFMCPITRNAYSTPYTNHNPSYNTLYLNTSCAPPLSMFTVHQTPIIIQHTIPHISTIPVPHHSQCLQYTRHQSSSISQYPVSQHFLCTTTLNVYSTPDTNHHPAHNTPYLNTSCAPSLAMLAVH